jgi:hypothetical protein
MTVAPCALVVDDASAYTLGHEDILANLCQHLRSHVNVWDFGRLIWTADIVSLAERFAAEIDWEWVERRYPVILHTLSLIHSMTPLGDALIAQAPFRAGRTPKGVGQEYRGWHHVGRTHWREIGCRQILRDTLFPSEWWLRLRYGLGGSRRLFWYRWIRHPLCILGHAARTLLEGLGWPTSLELAGHRARRASRGRSLP